MQKLELEQIAPYLGKGISLIDINTGKVFGLNEFYNTIVPEEFREAFGNTGLDQLMADDSLKLILLPMSVYMEESGMSFEEFASSLNEIDEDSDDDQQNDNDYTARFLFGKAALQSDRIALGLFEDLVTDQYDVFGLIEKGLAVDATTVDFSMEY